MKERSLLCRNFVAGLALFFALSACSSSPIQARLDKNFVYNCTLELFKKGVAASDAERICSASHRGELQESELALSRESREPAPAPIVKHSPAAPVVAQPAPAPAPAAAPAPSLPVPERAPASTEKAALPEMENPVVPGSH